MWGLNPPSCDQFRFNNLDWNHSPASAAVSRWRWQACWQVRGCPVVRFLPLACPERDVSLCYVYGMLPARPSERFRMLKRLGSSWFCLPQWLAVTASWYNDSTVLNGDHQHQHHYHISSSPTNDARAGGISSELISRQGAITAFPPLGACGSESPNPRNHRHQSPSPTRSPDSGSGLLTFCHLTSSLIRRRRVARGPPVLSRVTRQTLPPACGSLVRRLAPARITRRSNRHVRGSDYVISRACRRTRHCTTAPTSLHPEGLASSPSRRTMRGLTQITPVVCGHRRRSIFLKSKISSLESSPRCWRSSPTARLTPHCVEHLAEEVDHRSRGV